MTGKKIVHYTAAHFQGDPVGKSVYLQSLDHPDFRLNVQMVYGLHTSRVVSYDETTGIIETLNTVYVPAGPDETSPA